MKRRAKRGVCLLFVGVLLLGLAGGFWGANVTEDRAVGKQAAQLLEKVQTQAVVDADEGVPPVLVVEENTFCGTVRIPALGVELPVFDTWDHARLKEAPCRYAGGVDTDDLIVAAHNYESHFGHLERLRCDDTVLFTDAVGVQHIYAVKETVMLDGAAVEDMKAGGWDLTLFTCTKSGRRRVTVRCEKIA